MTSTAISIFVTMVLVLSAVAGIAAADEWPDDDARQVSFGSHSGEISSTDDTDRFQIPASAGQVIDLGLSKEAGDDVTVSVYYPGGDVYLYNDGGTDATEQITVEEDGPVRISVDGNPSGGSIPWTVSVTDSGVRDEWLEARENQVDLGSHGGSVNSNDDSDEFEIPVSAGQVIDLSLSKEAGDDLTASVYYPGGDVYLYNDAGTSSTDQITIEEDGFVRVYVEGNTDGSDLPWTMSVTDSGVRDEWLEARENQASFGSHSGSVNSNDDSDEFEIPVSAGQVIDLDLSKEAGDDLTTSVYYPGGDVYLYNDAGTSSRDQITIEEDGFVRVYVEGNTDGSDLPWTVSVTDSGVRDDWLEARENQVDLGSHGGSINSNDDSDEFEIPVSSGTEIDLTLSKEAGDDVTVSVYYPGGDVYLYNDGGTGDSASITLEEDGFVRVYVEGNTEGGDLPWRLSVIDSDGSRQTATPTETPTATRTETPTLTDTVTPTEADTSAPTDTPITTATDSPTETATDTHTPTATEEPAESDTERTTPSDQDGDGVPDDEDYAPRDPDVQSQDDLVTEGSGPGFGVLAPAIGLLWIGVLARARRRD